MKKLLLSFACLATAIATVCFPIAGAVAATPALKLYTSPSSASIRTGDVISLQIRLSKHTSDRVDYVDAQATFPAGTLAVVATSKQGGYFSLNGGPTIIYSNSKGTISVKGYSNPLPNPADVLIATISFQAKKSGKAVVNFSSSSQSGDITNGGHVKNVLDSMSGTALTISDPVVTTSGGNSGSSGSTSSGSVEPTSPTAKPATTTNSPATDASVTPIVTASEDSQGQEALSADTLTQKSTAAATSTPKFRQVAQKVLIAAAVGAVAIVLILAALTLRHRREAMATKHDEHNLTDTDTVSPAVVVGGMVAPSSDSATTVAPIVDALQPAEPEPPLELASAQPTTMVDVSPPPNIVPQLTPSPAVSHETILQPLSPQPSVPMPQSPVVPAPAVASTSVPTLQPIAPAPTAHDNGEPLDMFEAGEQRLSNEGYQSANTQR